MPIPSPSDSRALHRAASSLPCLPFRRELYELVAHHAISSGELASRGDVDRLLFRRFPSRQLEDRFIWLIRLGVLRREVDGQGLTERVRLTPLGRRVLDGWPGEIPRAGLLQRLRHGVRRHWPRL